MRSLPNNFPDEQTKFVSKRQVGKLLGCSKKDIYIQLYRKIAGYKQSLFQILPGMFFLKSTIKELYFDTTSHLIYCTFIGSAGIYIFDSNFHRKNCDLCDRRQQLLRLIILVLKLILRIQKVATLVYGSGIWPTYHGSGNPYFQRFDSFWFQRLN